MRLYLIQHGDALDKSVDPDRPLSEAGLHDVEAMAAFLAPLDLDLPAIWHSGKTRAKQTADLLATRIANQEDAAAETAVAEVTGLTPKDPVKPIHDRVEERADDSGGDLAIVGHLPHVARLASLLLTHRTDADVVAFQKGAVLCLERQRPGRWHVVWMVAPGMLQR